MCRRLRQIGIILLVFGVGILIGGALGKGFVSILVGIIFIAGGIIVSKK